MQTECSADLFGFAPVEGRAVVAAFDSRRQNQMTQAQLGDARDKFKNNREGAGCGKPGATCSFPSKAPNRANLSIWTIWR